MKTKMMEQHKIIKDQMKDKLMTVRQAANYLCICERKLWDLQKSQRIPVVRIDRSVRFDRNDLDSFIAESKR